MATNPFSASACLEQQQQQNLRRERVKITFYTVLGALIVLCLGLLFQGCKHYEPSAENPIKNPSASAMNLPVVSASISLA